MCSDSRVVAHLVQVLSRCRRSGSFVVVILAHVRCKQGCEEGEYPDGSSRLKEHMSRRGTCRLGNGLPSFDIIEKTLGLQDHRYANRIPYYYFIHARLKQSTRKQAH